MNDVEMVFLFVFYYNVHGVKNQHMDIYTGGYHGRENRTDRRKRCIRDIDSSLKYHLMNAKNHGVTRKEMAAIITHTAFYCSWSRAWAVFNLAKEVYADEE